MGEGGSQTAAERRVELRQDVALMRELGVIKWGDVLLGPAPLPALKVEPPTPEEEKRASLAARRAHYEQMLNRSITDDELARLP